MKAAVIGSGIGGLASAIRLAVKGYEVTVYEKNSTPGGKLSQLHINNFRFDTGPSLFTLPELVDELFVLCNEKMEDYLTFQQLDNNCKYFFADGSQFNFYLNKTKLKKEIEQNTKENPEPIFNRLTQSEKIYNATSPIFIFNPLLKYKNFTAKSYKKAICILPKLNLLSTMHEANQREFVDSNIVQLFNRYATYNGSSPYKAPATLNMIAHLENNIGAFFPNKGMYSIIESLHKLAIKKEISFSFDTLVSEIVVENKKAIGIKANQQTELFDIIISDSDTKYLANNMVVHPQKKRINTAEPSSSALIFYWGIDKTFPELELHNIIFSSDYKKEFEKIFDEHTLIDDPTIYLFISSKIVESDAPRGSENWYVMINAPSNFNQDWESLTKTARINIIKKINKKFDIDIEKHIISEQITTPLAIEKNTLSTNGALYGNSSNSIFSAFRRHSNWIRSIKNLYFVGGTVHPGGGIPLCLASAKIIDQEIPLAYE